MMTSIFLLPEAVCKPPVNSFFMMSLHSNIELRQAARGSHQAKDCWCPEVWLKEIHRTVVVLESDVYSLSRAVTVICLTFCNTHLCSHLENSTSIPLPCGRTTDDCEPTNKKSMVRLLTAQSCRGAGCPPQAPRDTKCRHWLSVSYNMALRRIRIPLDWEHNKRILTIIFKELRTCSLLSLLFEDLRWIHPGIH